MEEWTRVSLHAVEADAVGMKVDVLGVRKALRNCRNRSRNRSVVVTFRGPSCASEGRKGGCRTCHIRGSVKETHRRVRENWTFFRHWNPRDNIPRFTTRKLLLNNNQPDLHLHRSCSWSVNLKNYSTTDSHLKT